MAAFQLFYANVAGDVKKAYVDADDVQETPRFLVFLSEPGEDGGRKIVQALPHDRVVSYSDLEMDDRVSDAAPRRPLGQSDGGKFRGGWGP
jgi:hypothetical protein